MLPDVSLSERITAREPQGPQAGRAGAKEAPPKLPYDFSDFCFLFVGYFMGLMLLFLPCLTLSAAVTAKAANASSDLYPIVLARFLNSEFTSSSKKVSLGSFV